MILPSPSRSLASTLLSVSLLTASAVLSGALAQGATAQKPAHPAAKPKADAKPAAKPAATADKAHAKTDTKAKADAKKTDAKAKPAPAAAPGGGQAALLASFGDWGAYATQSGKAKICYALSQPKDREPKSLNRDPGFLFVSFRPAENVKNEIALMMGFPVKENGPAEAVIGNTSFALVSKDQNAWVKNPAEEPQMVAAMAKGQSLVVKIESRRGNKTSDRYSLSGFAQALERVRKECP